MQISWRKEPCQNTGSAKALEQENDVFVQGTAAAKGSGRGEEQRGE